MSGPPANLEFPGERQCSDHQPPFPPFPPPRDRLPACPRAERGSVSASGPRRAPVGPAHLLGTSPRWQTCPQRGPCAGLRARCRSRVRKRSRASSRSADSQPARVLSEAVGSASGPPPATSYPALRPARPPLQPGCCPLGRPSVGAKEVRPRAIQHLLLRSRLPSRAQVVSPRTAPLTRPSQAGPGRPALPQPGSRATSRPERNLKCWARCECLAPAPRLRLLACRHPSRGSVRLPPSPRCNTVSSGK